MVKKFLHINLLVLFVIIVLAGCIVRVPSVNNPPAKPSNPSPTDKAYNISLVPTLTLSWECSDPDNDSLTYDIYLGEDTPTLVESGYTKTSYTPDTLSYDKTYYWKIVAKDAKGAVAEGDIWSFTVESGDGEVNFNDENLENAVRRILRIKSDQPVTKKDMLSLQSLSANESGISDLSGLEYALNLRILDLSMNQVSDISVLSGLVNLRELCLYGNQIEDISALENLVNLYDLELSDNQISDISILSNLTNLIYLDLSYNNISDIQALKNLVNLVSLSLDGNQITDISAIKNLVNLTGLYLGENQISDISAISNLLCLRELYLNDNQISDMSPIANLSGLRDLYLSNNQIQDISALSNFEQLYYVDLSYNQIENIPALYFNFVYCLDLGHNEISDISGLKDIKALQYLYLNNNQIEDITPLVESQFVINYNGYFYCLIDVGENNLDLTPGSDDMNNIQAIIDKGINVYY